MLRIYLPMLFVGIGGTGCRVGAELERLLRAELCKVDGTELQRRMPGANLMPFQLPGCIQFVYADLAEREFDDVEKRVVPHRSHLPAAEQTMTMVRDLVPPVISYAEVARSLRVSAKSEVARWLPPSDGSEPKVAPLNKGAGQLPTIGRAALFETFRGGLAPVRDSLFGAIAKINNARGQLDVLADGQPGANNTVDVFVACSVAGGTGGGLFYDYLHLVDDALRRSGSTARIFPLIVMPSAFPEGLGGGRAANLNAARALLDLFELVDSQNAPVADNELGARNAEGLGVIHYPGRTTVSLRPATVQTAILFSGSKGLRREDLHRSMVSLVLSLIGSNQARAVDGAPAPIQQFQSFADSFINNVDRGMPAAAAIGRRGVSTSSVASLTVPVDELAEIVASRLLADAVSELDQRAPGTAENNRDLVHQFFSESKLDKLWNRSPLTIDEPKPVNGTDAILKALGTRQTNMQAALEALKQELAVTVPELAKTFDYRRAIDLTLARIDLLRLRRVVLGDDSFDDQVSKRGLIKMVQSRGAQPQAPDGINDAAPQPTVQRTKWWRRPSFGDKPVREVHSKQTEWYKWRSWVLWHAAWNDQAAMWERSLKNLEREVLALTDAFLSHAATEDERFKRRERALFEPRVGVSYLLPKQGELDAFYRAVVRRFVDFFADAKGMKRTATVGELLNEILGDDGWQKAYAESIEHGPDRAVAYVRDRVGVEVRRLFSYRSNVHRPLLASLNDLLSAAAGRNVDQVDEDDRQQLRRKLVGLVPGDYAPAGTGDLKVLFSYPSNAADPLLESFLQGVVALPRSTGAGIEWRPIDTELITVVMFRSSMGLADVPEVQEVLTNWADAVQHPRGGDFLQWRQRLDYRFSYLAANAEDRVRVLHHLLCAAWNGTITTHGKEMSPDVINVRVDDDIEVNMRLDLTAFGRQSSWGSVLGAYERWVLYNSEPIRPQFSETLASVTPHGITTKPSDPHPLFTTLCELAGKELAELETLLANADESNHRQLETLRQFWDETFQAALRLPFRGVQGPVQPNLGKLDEWVRNAPAG